MRDFYDTANVARDHFDTVRKAEAERAKDGSAEHDGLTRFLAWYERTFMRSRRTREAQAVRKGLASRRPFKVLAVSSNKGGVGKTTISSNLAVYIRALRPSTPVLIMGLDDQSLLDGMFAMDRSAPEATVATGLRAGTFNNTIREGQYGVHYVPSTPKASEMKRVIRDPLCMAKALHRTDWKGLVILDTKSDLEILTRNALAASDLVLVPVNNHTSLWEAEKIFSLFDEWGWSRERARIILSMIDLRIKYKEGDHQDVLSLLVEEIREYGYPLLESFISDSAKVESLSTNPGSHVKSVLYGAKNSIVNRQLRCVAHEVLETLDSLVAPGGNLGPGPGPGPAIGGGLAAGSGSSAGGGRASDSGGNRSAATPTAEAMPLAAAGSSRSEMR